LTVGGPKTASGYLSQTAIKIIARR
jgi:hypothetical protein